jgi:hypothetical protein
MLVPTSTLTIEAAYYTETLITIRLRTIMTYKTSDLVHWSSLYKLADESLTQECATFIFSQMPLQVLVSRGPWKSRVVAVSSELGRTCLYLVWVSALFLELGRTCLVCLFWVSIVSPELGRTSLDYLVWVSALFSELGRICLVCLVWVSIVSPELGSNLSWLLGLGVCVVFRIGSNPSWLPGPQFHGALPSCSKHVSKYYSETTEQLRRVYRPSY